MASVKKPLLSTIYCSNCDINIDINQLNHHQCLNIVKPSSKYKNKNKSSIKTRLSDLSTEFSNIIHGNSKDIPSMISPSCSTSSTSSLHTPRSSIDYFERFLQKQDVEFFCSQKTVVRINSRGHRKKEQSEENDYILDIMIEELIEEINHVCNACSLPISSGMIRKNNIYYHDTCYCCNMCAIPLSLETSFQFDNGKIYCHRDYEVMKYRSNTVPLQKTCFKCRMILSNADYKTFKNRMYCKSDFEDMFCRGCSKPIDDKVISATDGKLKGKWHIECFNCQLCHQPFPDNLFYVYDNLPYCKRHYHKMNNTLCIRCYNPIEGYCAYIPGQEWKFHPDCFRCQACQNKLEDTYHLLGGRIYCDAHINNSVNKI